MTFKRLILAAGILALAGLSRAQAYEWETRPDKQVWATYRVTVPATTRSTAAVIVDLSNNTDWPHEGKGYLRVSHVRINMDRVAAATATVRLGVVNYVGPSTGSVSWFHIFESSNNVTNTLAVSERSYLPSYLYLKVDPSGNAFNSSTLEGSTPGLITNEKTSASTVYQNDIALPSLTSAHVAPGKGDIVMEVLKDATNLLNVVVEVLYDAVD